MVESPSPDELANLLDALGEDETPQTLTPAQVAFIQKLESAGHKAAATRVRWELYAGSPADTPAVHAVHAETERFVEAHPEYATIPAPAKWTGDDIETASPNDPRRGGRWGTNDSVFWSQTELDYQAMQLRARGMDFRSIARTLGMVNEKGQPKESTVRKMVKRGLAKAARAHGADEARTLDLARIDRMIEKAVEIMETSQSPDRALRAMDRLTVLIDQRAKLLGTHAPTKVQTNATLGGSLTVKHEGAVEVVTTVREYLETLDAVVVDEIEERKAVKVREELARGDEGDDVMGELTTGEAAA